MERSSEQQQLNPGYSFDGILGATRDLYAGNNYHLNLHQGSATVDTALRPTIYVPFSQDKHFVDRAVLDIAVTKCFETPTRIALVGLGGVGKSQIAIECCYRLHEAIPDAWIFWVHASSVARFEDGFTEIANHLKIELCERSNTEALRLVKSWLSNEHNGRWILVLDNADDDRILLSANNADGTDVGQYRSITDYLPHSKKGSIIITSRNKEVARALIDEEDDILDVAPMQQDEAVKLARTRLNSKAASSDAEIISLVRQLDCMPLAITQAVAHINRRTPRLTVSQFLSRIIENDSNEMLRLLARGLADPRRNQQSVSGHENAILRTWYISFNYIDHTHRSAARLLGFMSLLNREKIQEELLSTKYAQSENVQCSYLEDDLEILQSFDLVYYADDKSSFRMHRLVQLSTRDWLYAKNELDPASQEAVRVLNTAFPHQPKGQAVLPNKDYPRCIELLPHVIEISGLCSPNIFVGKDLTLLQRAKWYCSCIGRDDILELLTRKWWRGVSEVKGFTDFETLSALKTLAALLMLRKNFTEAQILLEEACTAVADCPYPRRHELSISLAEALAGQGRYTDVETTLLREIKFSTTARSEALNSRIRLDLYNMFARLFKHRGLDEESLEYHRWALELCPQVHGEDSARLYVQRMFYAAGLCDAKRYIEAEMQIGGIEKWKKKLGEHHQSTIQAMWILAIAVAGQGRVVEAIPLMQEVTSSLASSLGPEAERTLDALHYLDFLKPWSEVLNAASGRAQT